MLSARCEHAQYAQRRSRSFECAVVTQIMYLLRRSVLGYIKHCLTERSALLLVTKPNNLPNKAHQLATCVVGIK